MLCMKLIRGTMVVMVAASVVFAISSCGKRGKLKKPSEVSAVEMTADLGLSRG